MEAILVCIGLIVYVCLPATIQFVLSVINMFIPYPIPYLDEIIMWGVWICRIRKFLDDPEEYMEKSCLGFSLAVIIIVIAVVGIIIYFISHQG